MLLLAAARSPVPTAAPLPTRGIPLPPFDPRLEREWRAEARWAAQAVLHESGIIHTVVPLLRAMLDADVVGGVDNPRTSALFGSQARWSSIEYNRFIPASVQDVKEHLAKAETMELPADLGTAPHLTTSLMTAIARVAALGGDVSEWRQGRLQQFAEISDALLPVTQAVYQQVVP